jgi:hypothetical protein
MTDLEPLDYEHLVATFESDLLVRLRRHRSDVPFLETWVPDADLPRSILNMVEAAEACGQSQFSLRIPKAMMSAEVRHRLEELVSGLAETVWTERDGDLDLCIQKIGCQP